MHWQRLVLISSWSQDVSTLYMNDSPRLSKNKVALRTIEHLLPQISILSRQNCIFAQKCLSRFLFLVSLCQGWGAARTFFTASSDSLFHPPLSLVFFFQSSSSPAFLTSLLTQSSHISLGRPLLLFFIKQVLVSDDKPQKRNFGR